MSVEFNDPAGTQNIDFASATSAVGLTSFSLSLWFYPDSVSATSECGLLTIWDGTGTDADQYVAIFRPDAGEQKIRFKANFSTTNGAWITTSNQITTASQWYHICVTYNGAATTNDPVIYINGASKPITEIDTPVGTFRTGTTGVDIFIGATSAGFAPDGKMSDVRVYNAVLTAAQVNALYSAGAHAANFDTNLVFNAPLTTSTALSGASFDGYTLTASQLLIDRIGCAQGTPSGSPLGSTTEPS